jgi:hypothetical protein
LSTEVDQPGPPVGTEPGDELLTRVVQAEDQEQQDHTDRRSGLDEVAGGHELGDAALTEGEAGQQVEGDR